MLADEVQDMREGVGLAQVFNGGGLCGYLCLMVRNNKIEIRKVWNKRTTQTLESRNREVLRVITC